MSCEKIQRQEPLEGQATAIMDSFSFFDDDPTTVTTTNRFSNLHITTHPPCSTCGCSGSFTAAPSSSSVSQSHKRPSSEPSLSPNPKKHNHPNSPFSFSKIPLPTTTTTASPSSTGPLPSQPPLRRTVSDPSDPFTTLVTAESPQSPPQQNADVVACSGTPFSAAKLPPRPPTLRRSVSDPMPSPAKTFSCSCDTGAANESPNARLARRMSSCFHEMTRKWDALLTIEEESGSREDIITNQINNNDTNNQNSANDETKGNSEEGYVEAVAEKIGEFLSIRLTCPCGRSYQILLSGQNCFYRVS